MSISFRSTLSSRSTMRWRRCSAFDPEPLSRRGSRDFERQEEEVNREKRQLESELGEIVDSYPQIYHQGNPVQVGGMWAGWFSSLKRPGSGLPI